MPNNLGRIASDYEAQLKAKIRLYPLIGVLIGLAVGFLLGKML